MSITHLGACADAEKEDRNEIITLEEQKMLLLSLAMKENVAKGFSGSELQSLSPSNLDYLKKETCAMLQDTWNRSGRKHTRNSRLQYTTQRNRV
jgi:hypothetical protein